MNQSALHIPGKGEPIHFYHANGFPAEVYMPFLSNLSHTFDVHALNNRAIWENSGEPTHKNWQVYADDLIEFLEATQSQPVIGIGHSMGASSTILAAVTRPELFKALVLIEPAMLNLPKKILLKLMPKAAVKKLRLVSGTANKPDTWKNSEVYKSYIKKFKGYQQFSEAAFDYFAQHAIKKTPNNDVTLRFPKQWEAHNYTQAPYLMGQLKKLNKLGIPTLAIRGEPNGFFNDALWKSWQQNQPNALFYEDKNFGHLIPLEAPKSTVSLINRGLDALGII